MNDLLNSDLKTFNRTIIFYAYDAVIIINDPNWAHIYDYANKGLEIIKNWLDENVLS